MHLSSPRSVVLQVLLTIEQIRHRNTGTKTRGTSNRTPKAPVGGPAALPRTSGSISCSSHSSWSNSAALRPLRMASSSMSRGSDMAPEALAHVHTRSVIHADALPWARGHCERREERGRDISGLVGSSAHQTFNP